MICKNILVHILSHPVNIFIISQQKTYIVLSVIRLLTSSVLIGLAGSAHTSWVVCCSWSDEFGSRAWAHPSKTSPTNAIGCVSSTYSQKLSSFRPVRLVVGSRPIPGIGAQGLKGAPRLSVWTHVVGQQKS